MLHPSYSNIYSSYTQIMSTSLLTDPYFLARWLNQKLFFRPGVYCYMGKSESFLWNQISETACEKTYENWSRSIEKCYLFRHII